MQYIYIHIRFSETNCYQDMYSIFTESDQNDVNRVLFVQKPSKTI